MKKITVLGGGTGTFVVLSGLKQYPLDLGVIVTMMDSGGSTGRLRDQLGVLPPGDLRQSLLALSEAPLLWRKLFLYRFEHGDLEGHNFGNIFLSALEKVSENYDEVISTVSYVLKTKGTVIPVTFAKSHLCVDYKNGKKIKGETNIDENHENNGRILKAYLDPEVKANPKAIARLKESDCLVIGPGDLYTSIIPNLIVGGIKDVILTQKLKVIYNLNLMTKMGQTAGYSAANHVNDLSRYLGKYPDVVTINNGEIPQKMEVWYQKTGEQRVLNDLKNDGFKGKIIVTDLVDRHPFAKSGADRLTRSILRHDPNKLGKTLYTILV